MIVTEKEAAKKWCPHFRAFTFQMQKFDNLDTTVESNRLDLVKGPQSACCLGSRCMAWRWGTGEYVAWRKPNGSLHVGTNVGLAAEGEHGEQDKGWLRIGHCGLVGNL